MTSKNPPSAYPLRKSALTLAITAALSTHAVAQESTEATSSGTLEEVIVTATKRAVNLQEVPIAITTMTGAQMVDLQINNILDLDKHVPGMVLNNSGNDPDIILRGAGAAGTNDVAVPIYVDGMYRPRQGQALASYLDVERVEVLRGPQGTLFGRNTLGGLVNFVTNKPKTDALEYGGAFTFGNYTLLKFEGMANIPLGETVAFRVAASNITQDPFVKNIYRSDGGLKDQDTTYVRAQLNWEATDTFSLLFTGTYWEDTANGNADYSYKVLGVPVNPVTQKTNGIDGVMDPRQGTRTGWGGGRSQAGNWPTDWTADILPVYQIATDIKPERDIKEWSFSTTLNWDIGFADLYGQFGYFDYEEYRLTDTDISPNATEWGIQHPGEIPPYSNGPGYWQQCWGGPSCGLVAGQRVNSTAYQADVNMNSNGDGALQWTLGLYYYDDSGKGDTSGEFVWGYTDSIHPQQVSWAHWLYQGNGGTKSTAVYGQATYSFTDKFRLNGGLRYSTDKRKTFTKVVDFGPGVHHYNPNYYQDHLDDPGSRFDDWPSFVDSDTSEIVNGKDHHTDWRVALQYDFTDLVMGYASASTGYIAGTPKGGGTTQLTDPNEVDAYEIGVKSMLLDDTMRLNAAIYDNKYKSLSVTEFVQKGGTILAQQVPGGSMTAKGLELEMDWQATEALNVTAGLALTNAKLDEFHEVESRFAEGGVLDPVTGKRTYTLDGKKARFSPDWTLSLGVSYDVDMGSYGMLVPSLFIFVSDDYKTQNVEYFFAHQDSYSLVDLATTWYPVDSNFSVQLFVKNLGDVTYLTETTVYSGARAMADYNNPRTYGIRAAYNF